MKRVDVLTGFALLVFAAYLIHESDSLQYYYEFGPGPGFFPFWIALLLLILGLGLLGTALLHRQRPTNHTGQMVEPRRALGTWLGFVVMIALVERMGFFLTFTVYTSLLVLLLDRRPVTNAVTIGIGSAVGFYLVFVYAFGLRLPAGPWGF